MTLEIEALSYGTYGVGREQGKAILVPLTAPGDRVAADIVEDRGKYAVGELARVIAPSPLRQSPPCPYFGDCGGCPWQHVRYDAQLAAKQKNVLDALRRIGKLDRFELRPILSSPREYRYRRRIRLQADAAGRLGFYRAASHELIEIESCLIADERLERPLARLRRWRRELRTAVQQIEMTVGDEPEPLVVVARAGGEFAPEDEAACVRWIEEDAGGGLILYGRGWRREWGRRAVALAAEGDLRMAVDGDVFTQVNPEANQNVLQALLGFGDFRADDRVLELYCGAGNFTLSVAKRAREVTAVEGHLRSVDNGKRNAEASGLGNIRWIGSHVPKAVAQLKKRRERFSKIILNPPRSGAKGIDRDMAGLGAEKILYVSCNPATLARDLSALAKHGYTLTRTQPIDLFPHTYHVETVAEMVR